MEEIKILHERSYFDTKNDTLRYFDEAAILDELVKDKSSYMKRMRDRGTGRVRVGTSLKLEPNIYSLAMMANLKDEIIDKHYDIDTGKFKNLEQSIELTSV